MIPPADSTPVFHVPEGVNLNKEQVHAIRTMNRNFAQAYAAALDPIRAGTVVAQGGSDLTTAITQNGGCPGVASITNLAWLLPYMTPVETDVYGRPMPASPQSGHIIQTYTIRGSNRYGQGRYLKQIERLPFTSDNVVGLGLESTPAGMYDILGSDGVTVLIPAPGIIDPVLNAPKTDLRFASEAHSAPRATSGLTKKSGDDHRSLAIDTGDIHPVDTGALFDPTTHGTGLWRRGVDGERSVAAIHVDDDTIKINDTTGEVYVAPGGSAQGAQVELSTSAFPDYGTPTWGGLTPLTVPWDGAIYDDASFWDSGNPSYFTIPRDGLYRAGAQVFFQYNLDGGIWFIRLSIQPSRTGFLGIDNNLKERVSTLFLPQFDAQADWIQVAYEGKLKAGDRVALLVHSNVSTAAPLNTIEVDSPSFFWISRG